MFWRPHSVLRFRCDFETSHDNDLVQQHQTPQTGAAEVRRHADKVVWILGQVWSHYRKKKLNSDKLRLVGEAAKVVERLTVTNENYSVALTKLQRRYRIKNHIIDPHYKALPSTKPQATEYRRHLDVIETHLKVLQILSEHVEGSHLRVIIKEKFPDQVIYQVNLQVG